jgi:hypothetical protein
MTEIERIADQLNRAFEGEAWHWMKHDWISRY